MSRTAVSLRQAVVGDAAFLVGLWADSLRRADRQDQLADVELIVKEAAQSPDQRLLVAEYDGTVAGAVLLRLTTLSQLNLDPAVQVVSPHVAVGFRRKGVGHALMEAAVAFAEEAGAQHVETFVAAGSRDANRFMARMALGPLAVARIAATPVMRSRVEALRPGSPRGAAGRQLGQVLAARRSMRRSQALPRG
ncbi:GNAT family N-acetyltransferase [Nocardioides sp. SYSU D00038]|uniref:GNAT family N-acetyltransferase n=1 Tax=Nocardioides sp. SYSU D00038 TaxID=2812554 RepID=UPI0027DBB1E9|nr:GNAT family N-acetyltransferase [Nocardioides sp. SYSU D00038]